MSRSSDTTRSTISIGWVENPRAPGGGFAAEYLPVRRPCPMGEYASGTTPSSWQAAISPFVSGHPSQQRELDLVGGQGHAPLSASSASIERISLTE